MSEANTAYRIKLPVLDIEQALATLGAEWPDALRPFSTSFISSRANLFTNLAAIWPEEVSPQSSVHLLALDIERHLQPLMSLDDRTHYCVLLDVLAGVAAAQDIDAYCLIYDLEDGRRLVPPVADPGLFAHMLLVGLVPLDAAENEDYLRLQQQQDLVNLQDETLKQLSEWQAQFGKMLAGMMVALTESIADPSAYGSALMGLRSLLAQGRALQKAINTLQKMPVAERQQNPMTRVEVAKMQQAITKQLGNPSLPESVRSLLRQMLKSLQGITQDKKMGPQRLGLSRATLLARARTFMAQRGLSPVMGVIRSFRLVSSSNNASGIRGMFRLNAFKVLQALPRLNFLAPISAAALHSQIRLATVAGQPTQSAATNSFISRIATSLRQQISSVLPQLAVRNTATTSVAPVHVATSPITTRTTQAGTAAPIIPATSAVLPLTANAAVKTPTSGAIEGNKAIATEIPINKQAAIPAAQSVQTQQPPVGATVEQRTTETPVVVESTTKSAETTVTAGETVADALPSTRIETAQSVPFEGLPPAHAVTHEAATMTAEVAQSALPATARPIADVPRSHAAAEASAGTEAKSTNASVDAVLQAEAPKMSESSFAKAMASLRSDNHPESDIQVGTTAIDVTTNRPVEKCPFCPPDNQPG